MLILLHDVMMSATLSLTFTFLLALFNESCAQLRDRPRGLGLIRLPTGMTDERSSMFVPNLYIAGDKSSVLPQTIPDIHLPGQKMVFTGKTAFNPFTQAVSAMYHEDLTDAWGAGFGVSGVNNHALNVRQNFDDFADLEVGRHSGGYQPFITAMAVGGEYDLRKIRDVAGHLDMPLPGINELFDFEGRVTMKSFGGGVLTSNLDFPLSLADPYERFPASFNYLNFMADRFAHYGHVLPNVNLFTINRKKIMERLVRNKANPTLVG